MHACRSMSSVTECSSIDIVHTGTRVILNSPVALKLHSRRVITCALKKAWLIWDIFAVVAIVYWRVDCLLAVSCFCLFSSAWLPVFVAVDLATIPLKSVTSLCMCVGSNIPHYLIAHYFKRDSRVYLIFAIIGMVIINYVSVCTTMPSIYTRISLELSRKRSNGMI